VTAAGWYGGYLVWLLAGLSDFICHRRTDIANTSGLDEVRWHCVQIMLIGAGCLAWLSLEPGLMVSLLLGALVLVHAVASYIDTKTAYRRRAIIPVEQHLHSVLDAAPWIALAAVVVHTDYSRYGGQLQWRQTALPGAIWAALLAPATALCVLPAVFEVAQAMQARRNAQP
jgi:hypothetical protein